jgi:type VI protein secretion system component Hcp
MHKLNVILIIAIAFVLAAPCVALADKKKVNTPRGGITLNYGKIKYQYKEQKSQERINNPNAGSAIKSSGSGTRR